MKSEDPKPKSTAEGLLLAIDIEKRGHAFYTESAASTEDPRGRAMFLRLAQDEVRHLAWLEAEKDSLERTGEWEDVTLSGEALSFGARVFPEATAAESPSKWKNRELDVLRRGIQAEKDSMALYTELAGRIDDQRGKAAFQRLAQEEEGHFHLLQAEHEYLTRSGFYFDMPEFSLEGLE